MKPFAGLGAADREALLAEAAKLCAFVAPETPHDLALDEP
jgi:hypothetical protein